VKQKGDPKYSGAGEMDNANLPDEIGVDLLDSVTELVVVHRCRFRACGKVSLSFNLYRRACLIRLQFSALWLFLLFLGLLGLIKGDM
jgi:hypothetical protein